ncbi:MAG: R3H domain-containing nucleic acid-binding protein [Patescibacteria group bacterium]
MSDLEKLIVETIEKILYFIGVVAAVDVFKNITEEDSFHVSLSGDDLGVVIGYHGEGLSSLQTILGLMILKKADKWVHLSVDVNGYKREREEKIKDIVKKAVDRVKFTLKPVELSPMVSYERRIVHLEASKYEGIASDSIGDGFSRRVVIKPKE